MTAPGACPLCGVTGYEPTIHQRWHHQLDDNAALLARLRDSGLLYEAHTENLIERVRVLEVHTDSDDYVTTNDGTVVGVVVVRGPDDYEPCVAVRGPDDYERDAAHGC